MKMRNWIALLACFLLLCGCGQKTVITRENQIDLLSEPSATGTEMTVTVQPTTAAQTAPSETSLNTGTAETATSPGGETKPTTATTPEKPDQPTENQTDQSTESAETTMPTENAIPTETTAPAEASSETTTPTNTGEATEPTASTSPTQDTQPEKDPYDISGHTVGSLEYEIQAAINAERTVAGLAELSLNERLCGIASVRAYECSLYWSHTRPSGSDWSTVLGEYGYGGYSCAAENLLQSSDSLDAAGVAAIWASSDSHREKMCDPAFTRLGVGVYSRDGVLYLACIFTD